MNKNIMIVMGAGFLVAVLVAMLVQAALGGGKKKEPVKDEATTSILVAAKPLKTGDSLSETNAKWQAWPKSGVFEGAITKEGGKKLSDAAQGRVKRDIALGEPITKSSMVGPKVNFLAASLAPGMRAVSFSIKSSTAVAGFVAPGDRVDIMLTYKGKVKYSGPSADVVDAIIEKNFDRLATETIMQNVKVIALDQSPKRDEEKVKVGKTVTVEVDQKGAEILALATRVGSLNLSLRALGDTDVSAGRRPVVTDSRLTNIYDEIMEEAQAELGTGQTGNVVRIYSGDAVNQIQVVP